MIFTLIVVGVAVGPVRWEPPSLWSTEFGTPGLGVGNRVTSLSVDSGGLYAAGYVGELSTVTVNATPSQLFVSRYDLSGHQVWSQPLGNPFGSEVERTAGGSDGVYVVGALNETGFVRKFDLQGNEVWTDLLKPPPSSFSSHTGVDYVATGPAGVYAVGTYVIGTSTNTNFTTIFRGYDFTGNVLWTERIGGGINYLADNVVNVFASANGLYVSGFHSDASGFPYSGYGYLQKYDFNGTLVWNRQFTCVCWPSGVSGDGTGIDVAGRIALGTFKQAFVAKFDWDGNQLWMREFRPQGSTVYMVNMSANPSGVYLAIATNIGNYLSKYDGNGNSAWLFRIQLEPYGVSVGGSSVFVGGDTARGMEGRNAALSEFGQSSSLIFFGLIPPFSFLVVSLLIAAATISILWLRKRAKTRELELVRRAHRPVRVLPAANRRTCQVGKDSRFRPSGA